MREPVPTHAGLVDQASLEARVERIDDVVFVLVAQLEQHLELEVPANDSSEGEQVAGLVRQLVDASSDDLAHAFRDAQLVRRRPHRPPAVLADVHVAALAEVAEDLPDEERVALRLALDRLGERQAVGVQVVTGHRLHQAHDLLGGQALHRYPLDGRNAAEVGEHLGEGAGPVEVGVPVGADQEEVARSP